MSQRKIEDIARLQNAFSSDDWESHTEGCPDSGTLWASAAGELKPVENEAILLHLARCAGCASSWRLAREMIMADEAASGTVVPIEERKQVSVWRRPALLAAAAMVVIGLGTAALLHRGQPGPAPVYRQQQEAVTVRALPGTQELHRGACRLRWSGGPEGTRYDLTVTGKDLEILAVVRALTVPEYLLPREDIPRSVHTILWRVTAHLPDGRLANSRTFTSTIED